MTSASEGTVRAGLEARGGVVLKVEESTVSTLTPGRRTSSCRSGDTLDVTRALATLLPAGLPLARALAAAAEVTGPQVAAVVQEVQARVERGESLATALAEHPGLFPPLYTGLVRAGERSGNLAAAFQRLAQQLERDQQLRSKLISVSIYPLLLGETCAAPTGTIFRSLGTRRGQCRRAPSQSLGGHERR